MLIATQVLLLVTGIIAGFSYFFSAYFQWVDSGYSRFRISMYLLAGVCIIFSSVAVICLMNGRLVFVG